MKVTSLNFRDGQPIPAKHAHDQQNVSPALAWAATTSNAKEFAVLCDDPDAPRAEPWVHWVLFKIPAATFELREGSAGGAVEGVNDYGEVGYGGPEPPRGHGVHHYHFKVFALDVPLNLKPGASKKDLLTAIQGHVIDEGELIGTYERK